LKGQALRNCFTLEDGTDRLFRNVGKELPFYATYNPEREEIYFAFRQKPEITHTLILFMPRDGFENVTLNCAIAKAIYFI
jgi:hypothetical protein